MLKLFCKKRVDTISFHIVPIKIIYNCYKQNSSSEQNITNKLNLKRPKFKTRIHFKLKEKMFNFMKKKKVKIIIWNVLLDSKTNEIKYIYK